MVQPLTVLIIDDSPEDRQVYRRYLLQDQEHSYTILEEQSAEAALVLCQQFQPEVILLDFLLPDMDGLEFLAKLKQQSQAMPAVIMLTGYGNESVAVQAMKSGVQDYLVKGQTTAERLRSTIHSAIKNTQLSQELQHSEERFRTSVENMLDCFGIYSAIRNETGEILDFFVDYVNAAACEFSQMSQEQQRGKRLCEILPNFRENSLFDQCCQVVETGNPSVKESLIYSQQELIKAIDIRITKMGDGFVASWRDVTEKNQAQERLRQSHQFIEKILGYSFKEVQTSHQWLKEQIHPEDRERLAHQFHSIISANQNHYAVEYRKQHKEQQYRYLLDQGVITRDVNGRVVRLVGSTKDISDVYDELLYETLRDRLRKLAQLALQESEAKFRRIVESNIVGIYFGDFSGRVNEANEAFLQTFGYTREDLATGIIRWDSMTPPEYQTLDQQKIQELLVSGACTPFEKEYFHKNGTRVPVLLGIARIESTKTDGYSVCFVLDLSQRKRAEVALRHSEERYRYLSNAMPQLVWICNAKSECEHVNQRWYEFTGQTVEQATGLGWTKVIHPDDIQAAIQGWTQALETGEPYEQEIRYQKRDGSYCWHLARGMPIKDEQGSIIKWFGTSTDIDDRKQLEAERHRLLQLEQAARSEAEAANRTKDEFVAIVSHDLRSPLNAILGWAQLLRTRKFDEANLAKGLEIIERNARFQEKLLEDLLNMSRILQGKLQLEITQVNLGAIIGVAMETAYPSANTKNIRLESIVDKSIPPISGDINRLLQVLGNLLSNAIKFTPSGERVEIRLFRNGSDVQITVSDTGIGISPEFLPYVFERYYQGDSTHKQGGLGLGLAIARHLIELHSGSIQVASPGVGQGATFTIKLRL